jgi:hypothetical protein
MDSSLQNCEEQKIAIFYDYFKILKLTLFENTKELKIVRFF